MVLRPDQALPTRRYLPFWGFRPPAKRPPTIGRCGRTTTPAVGAQPPRPGLSTEPSLKGRVQPPDDEGARGKRARRPSMVAAAAAESSGVRGDVLHPIADEKNGASG